MTCAALAIGHVLGGPEPSDRTTPALASATRSPALGLLIASLNMPNTEPKPIVAAYLVASTLTVIPYLRWRRPHADTRSPADPTLAAAPQG